MTIIDFSFRELEIFCKVVELASFSKAAKAVFLVQASVSERIASLEKKVGTRLLDRLGRKVVPTAAGELLHKHATILLETKETARLEMESFLGLKQGDISMGGSTIPGEYILPDLIGRFNKKYPHIKEGIKSGLGLSILSARAINTELKAGILKALKIKGLSMSRNFYLIRNRLRIASPSCKAMLEFLLSEKP